MNKDQIWGYLVEHGIATKEELMLVTNINGFSVESLESVIYARCALNSIEQLQAELEGED